MANKILVARATKTRLEEIKNTLATNELVYSTDTGELGVKKANGDIEYFKNATDINAIDSKITDYVLITSLPFADGLNQLNNVDLQNVSDISHPEDIITISNIKIGHNIRLCINRPGGGYTEYGVATIIGLNEDETAIEVIVKKFSGSILNAQSQFLAIGTIIQHPDYPNNIYVNTMAGHFNLSNFEAALTANVIRPLLTDDPDAMAYFNYASSIYGAKYNLLSSAWNHSLTVDPDEIIADSTTSARGSAQYPNGETEGIIIPNGITTIGQYAFGNWTSNNQPLVIPSSVTIIGISAFYGWTSNNHPLVIPNSVISIGQYAFYGWSSNNQPLIIPNSVTSIESHIFYGWSSNNRPLIIPDSVTSIGDNAFRDWTSNNQPLVIPNSVTSIEISAFSNWSSNNQSLVIPDSVTSIGNLAFSGWSVNNQPLVIPNSVTSIGNAAFGNWTSNNHPLVIPDSVTNIGNGAFLNWSNVPYIEMKSVTPPTLAASSAFSGQNDAPIYVPDESVDDYKTATNWVSLANRIFAISDKDNKGAVTSINGKQGDVVLNQDDIGDGVTYKQVSQAEKNTWNDKQDKLVAGDNINIIGNTISASGGGSSTVQVDTLVWSSPILTPLGIDKLVIHYAYYDKNPRDVIVTLNVGSPVEIPLPVFASYSFAYASTSFAGAVITDITEVSPDYDFVVFTEDINRIDPFEDFKRIMDFNSTCRMIEYGGNNYYGISYKASVNRYEFGNNGALRINELGVGNLVINAGFTITSNPIFTTFNQGDLVEMNHSQLQGILDVNPDTLHNMTIYYTDTDASNDTIVLPSAPSYGLKFEFIKGAGTFDITFTGSVVSNRSTTITDQYDRVQLSYIGTNTWVLNGVEDISNDYYNKDEIDNMIGDIETLLGGI